MRRHAALASCALSIAVLTGLTACGSGDAETDTAADKPEATAAPAKEVSPAERLAKLVITTADVDGHNVEEPGSEFIFAKSQDEVTVDKKACAPLAYAMNQLPLGEPQADLTRVASKDPNAYTYVTLSAYEDDGEAESAMSGLSKAVDSCGGGFTAKANGNASPYDSVTAEKADPAGEESLAFKSTMAFSGVSHTVHTTAVRSDDVIAVYFAVDGRAIAEARPSDTPVSPVVAKAQNAKLG
ncbi:hypothetical protein ACFPH6_10625 [Streptomyces xiangluensis]|uniref:PknH-like extracellular domain-containing protein n=1 Tax=Streptomyces xiangluensis TaxID=2665720 RepID=A0ABV8YI95_9ACTN